MMDKKEIEEFKEGDPVIHDGETGVVLSLTDGMVRVSVMTYSYSGWELNTKSVEPNTLVRISKSELHMTLHHLRSKVIHEHEHLIATVEKYMSIYT